MQGINYTMAVSKIQYHCWSFKLSHYKGSQFKIGCFLEVIKYYLSVSLNYHPDVPNRFSWKKSQPWFKFSKLKSPIKQRTASGKTYSDAKSRSQTYTLRSVYLFGRYLLSAIIFNGIVTAIYQWHPFVSNANYIELIQIMFRIYNIQRITVNFPKKHIVSNHWKITAMWDGHTKSLPFVFLLAIKKTRAGFIKYHSCSRNHVSVSKSILSYLEFSVITSQMLRIILPARNQKGL